MGARRQPSPPPGAHGYTGPNQVKPEPPPAPPRKAEGEHTRGPWKLDCSFDIPQVIAHAFPKGATCVAVVYGDNDAIMARLPGEGVTACIPNARLIAAAPDLLEALKALVANVDDDMSGYWTESTANLMQQANEAIDRAEGRNG